MRRSSALIVAATLVTSVLLVPGTAHADVTDARLSVAFDELSTDRVATITLTASSASGITGVTATVLYPKVSTDPYATLQFERVDGTDHDGTWEATFRPDINTRPGYNGVEALITSADGETVTKRTGFMDCYHGEFADFRSAPATIDYDHPDVTVSGRVMTQKTHASPLVPVADARVIGPGVRTSSGQDGSFRLTTTLQPSVWVDVPAQGTLCHINKYADVTVTKQATQTTARLVPAGPVTAGTDMSIQGKVLRHGSAGLVPVAGVRVYAAVDFGAGPDRLGEAETAADGTFQIPFTARVRGVVTLSTAGTYFLTGGRSELGTMDIRMPTRITGFNASPEPGRYGDALNFTGKLVQGSYGISHAPLALEFSADGRSWSQVENGVTSSGGEFAFGTLASKRDGYWRVRYAGTSHYMPAVSGSDYVDIKYRTYIYSYNASPEPVRKGAYITVKGLLYRFMPEGIPGPGANIHIYFRPKGSSTWTKMAITKTARNGWFKKSFRASKDGTWLARYWGSRTYIGSNYPTDYVDVR